MNWINGQKYIPLLVGFGEPPLPPPPNDPMITEITEDDIITELTAEIIVTE